MSMHDLSAASFEITEVEQVDGDWIFVSTSSASCSATSSTSSGA
ncbi:hypothetical protein ABXS69_04560 [Actinomyces timonensis]|uniref:Thiocillin family RiPP n=1 Tax=Actinomyces timonensis TaxID=1288391 RepID=A0AAU8N460_9ACTO